MELDPRYKNRWIVVPLDYTMGRTRNDSIVQFNVRNSGGYHGLRKAGKVKAIKVSLEPRP
jgi:hypothetical protein